MRIPAIVLLAALSLPFALQAQQQSETGFMVQQMQVCPPENQGAVNEFNDDVAAPILNDLQEEGMIRSWYFLAHAWGDEWNNVIVTVADSHREWLDFWSEYVSRLNEESPGWGEEILPLCTMHKDNMYTITDGRSG